MMGGETYKDDLKEHLLVDLHELLVPLLNISGLLAGVGLVIGSLRRVATVVVAPLNHLAEDGFVDLEDMSAIESKQTEREMGSRWEWGWGSPH
jgi:hypothetical protein